MTELILLLIISAIVWFWIASLLSLEIAIKAVKQACAKAEVQFLDDTVAGVNLRLVRDEYGRRVFQRTYKFEFTETGNTRLGGNVILLKGKVESITMEPYQTMESLN